MTRGRRFLWTACPHHIGAITLSLCHDNLTKARAFMDNTPLFLLLLEQSEDDTGGRACNGIGSWV